MYILSDKNVPAIENLLNGIRKLLIGYYELYRTIKIGKNTSEKIQNDFV